MRFSLQATHTPATNFPYTFSLFLFWQRWQNIFPTATEINMLSSPVLGKLAKCHRCSSATAFPHTAADRFSDLLAAEANFLVIFSICVASHWFAENGCRCLDSRLLYGPG